MHGGTQQAGGRMTAAEIECQVCGASNPRTAERCRSCGARLAELTRELSDEEIFARRNQPDGFEWRWVLISFGLFIAMAVVVLGLLPMIIPAYDPQGFPGIMITIALWFIGATAINFVSPGKTFLEPPVGGFLAAIPTMTYLSSTADVYKLSMAAYILGALMAAMMALMGAFIGNLLRAEQAPRPPRRSRRPKSRGLARPQ